jgi:PPP family 3-phenylpropionic acid transporter
VIPVSLLFALIGASLGSFLPFLSVFLESRGFEPSTIGLIIAIGASVLTLALPVWGHLADVEVGRSTTLRVAALGALAASLVLASDIPIVAVAAAVIVLNATLGAFGSINDAIAVNALPDPARQYGRMRLLTSIAFALSALAAGQAYERTGYDPGPLVLAVVCAAVAIVAGFAPAQSLPGRRQARTQRRARRPSLGSAGQALSIQPRLVPVLVALVLIHVGVLVQFTYLPLRIVGLGGSPTVIAGASAASGLMEIPGTFTAAFVVRRHGLRALFVVSAFAYSCGLVGWAIATDLVAIVAIRAMSGFWFAGLSIGAVLTIRTILPSRLQATGQTLYQMVAFGLASVTANILGGLLYESISPAAPFAAAAVTGFAAIIVGWKVFPAARAGPQPSDRSNGTPLVA